MSSLATGLQDAVATSAPYADRLQRAQAEMARQGIDLLVVGASADLLYLIGYEGHESERMSVLVLPRDGAPHYVVPGLEAPLLHDQRDLLEIVPWEETEDPAAKVAAVAGAAALGTIAAGDELWSVFTLRLQRAMPRARWAEGGQLLRPLRMIKDEREIALLAEAARRTDEIVGGVPDLLDHRADRVGGSRPPDGAAGGARSAAGFLQRRQRTERSVAAPDRQRPRDRTRRCGRLRLGRHAGGL